MGLVELVRECMRLGEVGWGWMRLSEIGWGWVRMIRLWGDFVREGEVC